MNSEIIARLNQSLEMVVGLKEEEIDALAEKLAAKLTAKTNEECHD